jgi:hypothetical protein
MSERAVSLEDLAGRFAVALDEWGKLDGTESHVTRLRVELILLCHEIMGAPVSSWDDVALVARVAQQSDGLVPCEVMLDALTAAIEHVAGRGRL